MRQPQFTLLPQWCALNISDMTSFRKREALCNEQPPGIWHLFICRPLRLPELSTRNQNRPITKLKCLSFEQDSSCPRIRLSSAEVSHGCHLLAYFSSPGIFTLIRQGAAHLLLLICPTSFDRLSVQSRQGEKVVKRKKRVRVRSAGGRSRAGQRSKQPAERRQLAGIDMLSNRSAYNYTAEEWINVRHV